MVIMNNAQDLYIKPDMPYGEGITLQPFLHQVAGRATMMCLNETTVCKPLNYREHYFYKSLPPDILQFTPRFKGVVNVNIEETADGSVALTAYPYQGEKDAAKITKIEDDANAGDSSEEEQEDVLSNTCLSSFKHSSSSAIKSRIKFRPTGNVFLDVDNKCYDEISGEELTHQAYLPINPWIFKVYREGLRQHLQSKQRVVQKCILLENVTYQFRRPCVLDLKMGTRFHGDYDDDDKRMRHQKKCAATTTLQLGVRLSGMQMFHRESGRFLCRDKYFGRKLDQTGLRSVLHQFFYDGQQTRQELLVPVLKRLRSIRDSLRRLRTYRFYSSSLLIMYDGDSPNTFDFNIEQISPEDNTDHRLTSAHITGDHRRPIDMSGPLSSSDNSLGNNANTQSQSSDSCSSSACENEKLQNDSLVDLPGVPALQNEKTPSCDVETNPFPSTSSDHSNSEKIETNIKHSSQLSPKSEPGQVAPSEKVDIRMIDFAKATHQHMDSAFVHDGPDHGYIFGLTNLIKILKDISRSDSKPDTSYCDL